MLSEKAMTQISEPTHKSSNNDTNSRKSYVSTNNSGQSPVICFICGKDDHVVSVTQMGKRLVNYISCEKFVKMRPQERFVELKNKDVSLMSISWG